MHRWHTIRKVHSKTIFWLFCCARNNRPSSGMLSFVLISATWMIHLGRKKYCHMSFSLISLYHPNLVLHVCFIQCGFVAYAYPECAWKFMRLLPFESLSHPTVTCSLRVICKSAFSTPQKAQYTVCIHLPLGVPAFR